MVTCIRFYTDSTSEYESYQKDFRINIFLRSFINMFFLLALQPQFWALAYLHETLRFTSVY
jgi:hypothetical protein